MHRSINFETSQELIYITKVIGEKAKNAEVCLRKCCN